MALVSQKEPPCVPAVPPPPRTPRCELAVKNGDPRRARRVGVRSEGGLIVAIGAESSRPPETRRSRRRRCARRAAGQRPHPRGDDALPGQRRRPAADAVAGGADLAGRGEARGRGRLLGSAARLRRDDSHRDHAVLGHVLAARRRRGRLPTPVCAPPRCTAVRRRGDSADRGSELEGLGDPAARGGRSPPLSRRTRSTRSARARFAGSPRSAERGVPSRSTSPRRRRRSRTASPPTAYDRPHTSTGSGCSSERTRARPRGLARRRGAGADRRARAPSSPTRSPT